MPILGSTGSASGKGFGWIVPRDIPSDPFFNQVTLLLPGNGTNGSQNNTFLDSSSNNFTITRNGNTAQGAFSPYGYLWSNYFDGSGDYLSIPYNIGLNILSGDFTIECWFFHTSKQYDTIISSWGQGGVNASDGWIIDISNTNAVNFAWAAFSTNANFISSSVNLAQINQWQHVAVTRQGNNFTLWLDGVVAGTNTSSGSNSATYKIDIGFYGNGSVSESPNSYFNGYISNVRIVKGTAVYTTNFTPQTAPLSAITNTALLTCQSNRLIDNSANQWTVTRTGDVNVQPFSPFVPAASFASGRTGGSGYFDGSGDDLRIASNAAFALGTGDFTFESWIYPINWTNAAVPFFVVSGTGGLWIGKNGSNFVVRAYAVADQLTTTTFPTTQTWTHVVAVRSGTTLSLFFNGVRIATTTNSYNFAQAGVAIGSDGEPTTPAYFTGYISDIRLVKGSAVYNPSLTSLSVPTEPLTNITNTVLLLNCANGATVDHSVSNNLETLGNAQISTSVSRFGGGSMAFDGTGDYLSIPSSAQTRFDGSFTIEYWVYFNALPANFIIMLAGTSANTQLFITTKSTGQGIRFGLTGVAEYAAGTFTWSTGVWYHVALVRDGTVVRFYVNGNNVSDASYTNSTVYTGVLQIGGGVAGLPDLNGYIDDLRITKGVPRYLINFTPPSAPLPILGGTQYLDNLSGQVTLLIPGNGTNGAQNNTFIASNSASVNVPGEFGAYFDGNGDLLSAPSNTIWTWANKSAWTFEAWVHPITRSSNQPIYGGFNQTNSTNNGELYINTTGNLVFRYWIGSQVLVTSSGTVDLNVWSHIAFVFDGTNISLYINGSRQANVARQANPDVTTNLFYIGTTWGGHSSGTQIYFTGWISNVRVVNGTAVYTGASVTVPTPPLTAITNTALLTCRYSTFIDGSTNNFTITSAGNVAVTTPGNSGIAITRNGNATQGAFAPFGSNWSYYFDSVGDYLNTPANSAFAFGTDSFTIECWFFLAGISQYQSIFSSRASGGASAGVFFGFETGTSRPVFYSHNAQILLSGTSVNLHTWYHIALVRNGTAVNIYLNGTSIGSATNSTNFVTTNGCIGFDFQDSNWPFNGYISNLRIVKGAAVYTSAFTPSSQPLTAITNTVLLTCQSNRFVDNSSNAFSLTRTGDTSVQHFTPFNPTREYSTSTFGGSAYFDGSGDYLSVASSELFGMGTGNFTVESWVYPSGYSGSDYDFIIDFRTAGNQTAFALFYNSSYTIQAFDGPANLVWGAGTMQRFTWNHVALTRSGSTCTIWLNGVSAATRTRASNLGTSQPVFVGTAADNPGVTRSMIGYLCDLQVIKGTALYTSTFTPLTIPATVVSNTSLLLNFINAGIVDVSRQSTLETVGNAQLSTAQERFGVSSMLFDGNGDIVAAPYRNLGAMNLIKPWGSGNWTLECWLYFTSVANGQHLFIGYTAAGNIDYAIYTASTGGLHYYLSSNGSTWNLASAVSIGAIATGQWYHFAFVKNGSTWTPYLNGVAGTSTTNSTAIFQNTLPFSIGGQIGAGAGTGMVGYIDDVRVTKGIARYTANFTPPARAYPTR